MMIAAAVMIMPGALEPVRDRAVVVVLLVPGLAHARDEEDLVVHREAEEHREEEDRDPALDLRELVEPGERCPRRPTGRRPRARRRLAATESRFSSTAFSGRTSERNARISSRYVSTSTASTSHGKCRTSGAGSRRPAAARRRRSTRTPAGKPRAGMIVSRSRCDEACDGSSPYSCLPATMTCAYRPVRSTKRGPPGRGRSATSGSAFEPLDEPAIAACDRRRAARAGRAGVDDHLRRRRARRARPRCCSTLSPRTDCGDCGMPCARRPASAAARTPGRAARSSAAPPSTKTRPAAA